ncbi:hypothetical protein FB2170_06435 [Maribacter sp. HTCC2170]|nr:hypothetical protein FB2170_06435 [Maribacter sp. HTCC2170]
MRIREAMATKGIKVMLRRDICFELNLFKYNKVSYAGANI